MKNFLFLAVIGFLLTGCDGKPGATGPVGSTGSGVQTFTATFREGVNGYTGTLVNDDQANNATTNGPQDFSIYTSNSTANISRVLVMFPIESWIPQNATIKAASISGFINGITTANAVVGVHSVDCSWTVGTTWNTRDGAAAWGDCAGTGAGPLTSGTDFVPTPMSTVSTISGGTYAWTLSPAMVQSWLSNATNYGVVFMSEKEGTESAGGHVWLFAANAGTVSYRPELTVQYTIP